MAFGKRAGVALAALMLAACQTLGLVRQYEYDERVELSLDGSAVVDINASIPALVALRGATLSVDPEARFDRQEFRRAVRRAGRVGPRGQRLPPARPAIRSRAARRERHRRSCRASRRSHGRATVLIGWSTSSASCRRSAAPRGCDVGDVGWTGDELVAFRVHLPSRINFHNSPTGVERGNILVWEQTPARSARGRASPDGSADGNRVDSLPHPLAVRRNIRRGHGWRWPLVVWWVSRKGRSVVPA